MDLVKVSRIDEALGRWGERFQNRVFTPGEVRYCLRKKDPAVSFAARFAAKEAFVKALGIGIRRGVHWRDVEVQRGPLGKPMLKLNGRAVEMCRQEKIDGLFLSLTHDGEYSGAVVVLERKDPGIRKRQKS